ncbi:DoxX family protein [Pedobacter chinensis]|uniref:DoxX family protein n=1 Tax=Pedobacter chinensis TaxID=2282421 RepID=A0A369Q6A4_9SPHI|nr:DoxX family protein [Pedobacter chinensis]RDC57828.1 DoxX family protein [Pedobacter chinensis]
MFQKTLKTDNAGSTIIIRLMIGAVFLSEGIQKFLFPEKLGAGRFAKIGLPNPDFLGPFVGIFEITCGILILIGLFTRLSAIPLLIIMLVAMATTKMQLYIDNGFWSMLHDSRTDWAMLLGSIFLNIKGGGRWSLDKSLWNQNKSL